MTTIHTTAAEVRVRPARPADGATVAAMVREIAEHEGHGAHVHVADEQWSQLLNRPDVTVLLAEKRGHIAGYVSAVRQLHLWIGRDVLGLDDLYVRDGHRNGGIGRRLMHEIAALAAPEQLLIRWGVETANVDAQRFYRGLGANLRTKFLATWPPSVYGQALHPVERP